MTVSAPDLYEPKKSYKTPERTKFLQENVGIDSELLAVALGLPRRVVLRYQLDLGLRVPTGNAPRKYPANKRRPTWACKGGRHETQRL